MFTKTPNGATHDRLASVGDGCVHRPVRRAGIDVVACPACGHMSFADAGGPVSGHVALGRLFGSYDLVTTLPAVHAAGDEVMLYRPPKRSARSHLDAFAPHVWFSAGDGLWLSHDGDHLLLATGHRVPVRSGA